MQAYIFDREKDQALPGVNFERQFLQMRERIYHLVLRMLGNPSDAQDVTQETFIRAWSCYAGYDPTRSFERWVFRIATNLCIDNLRRRKRRGECSLDAPSGIEALSGSDCRELEDRSYDPEASLLAKEINERLYYAINALPPAYRRCLLLLPHYTYAEIAEVMHCPVGTIRSRIYRARLHLDQALAARNDHGA